MDHTGGKMIHLGICTGIENAGIMKEIGYDYIELGLSKIAALTSDEFDAFELRALASPLPVEVANSMQPGYFVLCGSEGTGDAVRAYLKCAFERAARLGVKVIVFGSGGARKLPDGMTLKEGMAYLAAFLRLAAKLSAFHGIRIAIEPLRTEECNIINTVAQAQELAALTDEENVFSLADLYHMMSGNEPYDALDNGIGVIHAHVAERLTRAYPKEGDGSESDYREFFRRLKNAGYEGRVSVEARCSDFELEAKASYDLLDMLRH